VSRSSAFGGKDLAATTLLALIALVLSLLPLAGWLTAVVLIPAILIAPGYAIGAALFRPGDIPRDLRVVLTVALSVSATALGGLFVQLFVGLDRSVLAGLLAFITIGAGQVARQRRRAYEPVDGEPRFRPPRVNPVSAAAIVAAVAVAAWGIEIATEGVHDQLQSSHFSSLWMVPRPSPSAPRRAVTTVRIGVSNHEGRTVSYVLSVRRGPSLLRRWRFRLGADQSWEFAFPASTTAGGRPLVGTLDQGGVRYSSVALEIGGRA
jgi:hypothetical protein